MCLGHRDKAKQHKKKVRASIKHTRDDAELSDAFTEVLRIPLNISGLPECAKRTRQVAHPHGNAHRCVAYSPNSSFKAHSPQLDSLHLNMSIWLVCSVTSCHKSRPLVRVEYIWVDVLRKTATLTSMKRNISTDCVTIFI